MKPPKALQTIFNNFTLKVFAIFFVVLLLLAIISNLIFIGFQKTALEKDMIKDGITLANLLAYSARLGVFAEDHEVIGTIIESAFQSEGVIEVCILDNKLQVLERKTLAQQTHLAQDISLAERTPKEFFDRLGVNGSPPFLSSQQKIDFWAPIHADSPDLSHEALYFETVTSPAPRAKLIIGYIGVAKDRAPLLHAVRGLMVKNSLLFGGFILICGLVTFFIVRTVTRPLESLIQQVGDYDIAMRSENQLVRLSGTFEAMVEKLRVSFHTINELKQGLEKKVFELQEEVNKRDLAEKALKESEGKARALLNAPAYLAVLLDKDGMIIDASERMAANFDTMLADFVGQNLWEKIASKTVSSKQKAYFEQVLRTGAPVRFEDEREGRWYDSFMFPLPDAQGNNIRVGILTQEITQKIKDAKRRQELEVQAVAQSKLASLGLIATGVAHEINQPLSYIKVVYEATLRDHKASRLDPQEMADDFREALRQVDRINILTDHLRTFGRADSVAMEDVSLPQVLQNTMTLMTERLKARNIRFVQEIDPSLPLVSGNANKLEQVFINLLQNAIDALNAVRDGEIRVSMSRKADSVVIRIADNGPGVPQELRQTIFEPFFTTKKDGEGTGLGLAITYGIIKDHKGSITCEPWINYGACFVIEIPAKQHEQG